MRSPAGGGGTAEVFVIAFGRSGRGLVVALVDVSAGCRGHPLPTRQRDSHLLPDPKRSWLLPQQGQSDGGEEGEEVTARAPSHLIQSF